MRSGSLRCWNVSFASCTSCEGLRGRGLDGLGGGMRFGLFIPQGWRHDLVGIEPAQHWGVMAGLARRADGIRDWESIWVFDHFHPVPHPTQEAVHEAWSLMAAFAGVTGRVRIGQMCTCMSYRNPAYLAKVAATVDVISEGRLEMGIGAGLVRARVARLRLRLPRCGRAAGAAA